MSFPITTIRRSAIKKTPRKKQTTKYAKTNFKAKSQYLSLKAPSNDVKMQSDKTLTTQTYFFLTIQQMENFIHETRQQVDKEKKK